MPPSPLSWCYRDLTWSPTSSVLWPEIIQNLSCDTHHSFLSSKNSIHLLCKVIFLFVVVQSLRHVQLFVTPWATARQDSLSITNSRSLLKLMSIDSVMPSNHLILRHPLLPLPLIFPSIRVFSNELALRIRWPKYWSCSFSLSPSSEYSGLIPFKTDRFDPQGPLKSLLQHHSLKASVLQHSLLYGPTLASQHDCWKNHGYD